MTDTDPFFEPTDFLSGVGTATLEAIPVTPLPRRYVSDPEEELPQRRIYPVAATRQRHPFEVYANDGGVSVVPGTVNEFIPTGGWDFEPSDTEQYIVLRASLAGDGEVEGAEISMETTVPTQPEGDTETGSAPSGSYRVVARIFVDGDNMLIENYVLGSQWIQCVVSQWNCDQQTVRAMWIDQALLPT